MALAAAPITHTGSERHMRRRENLSEPRSSHRIGVQYDSDVFGAFAESIANFLGTARFLVFQTIVIALWIIHNIAAPEQFVFDSWARGFVLLTLVLSVQASYAAPLILLAQSRQERRDQVTSENDREVAERTQSDTEFLAREIASVRVSISDIVTGEDFGDRIDRLQETIEALSMQVAQLSGSTPEDDTNASSSSVADEN